MEMTKNIIAWSVVITVVLLLSPLLLPVGLIVLCVWAYSHVVGGGHR